MKISLEMHLVMSRMVGCIYVTSTKTDDLSFFLKLIYLENCNSHIDKKYTFLESLRYKPTNPIFQCIIQGDLDIIHRVIQ